MWYRIKTYTDEVDYKPVVTASKAMVLQYHGQMSLWIYIDPSLDAGSIEEALISSGFLLESEEPDLTGLKYMAWHPDITLPPTLTLMDLINMGCRKVAIIYETSEEAYNKLISEAYKIELKRRGLPTSNLEHLLHILFGYKPIPITFQKAKTVYDRIADQTTFKYTYLIDRKISLKKYKVKPIDEDHVKEVMLRNATELIKSGFLRRRRWGVSTYKEMLKMVELPPHIIMEKAEVKYIHPKGRYKAEIPELEDADLNMDYGFIAEEVEDEDD